MQSCVTVFVDRMHAQLLAPEVNEQRHALGSRVTSCLHQRRRPAGVARVERGPSSE